MSEIPYRAAGTFDGEAYIERKADAELQQQIQRNQRFPYIVAARQSGKSSLIIRTFKSLDRDSFVCAFVDLAPMVIEDYREFWRDFLLAVAKTARLDREPLALQDPEDTLRAWLEQVDPRRLIIFVDEIDALLSANFREQFFSKVRTFFNNRAIDRLFSRVQFILVGSAHPSSLITDPKRSPFNVGIEVMLDELSEQQIVDLASHLDDSGALVSNGVAEKVYYYTNGSVYLSQLILEHLWGEAIIGLERGKASITEIDVDTTVEWVVGQASRNVHFENIFRLVNNSVEMRQSLRKLQDGAEIGEKQRQALQLTGISTGQAAFRNRIYERVFGVDGPLCLLEPVTNTRVQLGATTRVQLKPGSTLGDGRYRLVRKIGQGGFGAVWMALQTDVGRQVAIKVLHAHLAEDSGRRERFFRGAREMEKLGHEAIVRVLESHGEQDGDCYFVMEYVKGHDFRSAIKSRFVRVQDVVAIIAEVGQALGHAHRSGLVHRDVKPSNILLDADRRPRLTDFDLVRVSDQTGGTQTGAMGTFIYTAPEVMREAKEADETADIYSLAMTAVFGLYGRDVPMEVLRDAGTFIDNNLECSTAVKEVLKRAVTWNKEHRYADADEFCDDLVRAWDTGVTPAPRKKPAPAAKRARPADTKPSMIPPLTRVGKPSTDRAPTPVPKAVPAKAPAMRMPTRLYVENSGVTEVPPELADVPALPEMPELSGLPAPPSQDFSSEEPSLVTSAGFFDDDEDIGERSSASVLAFDAGTSASVDAPVTAREAEPARAHESASRMPTSDLEIGDSDVYKVEEEAEGDEPNETEPAPIPAIVPVPHTVANGDPTPDNTSPGAVAGTLVAKGEGTREEVKRTVAAAVGATAATAMTNATPVEHASVNTQEQGSSNRPIVLFVCMVAVLLLVFRAFDTTDVIEPTPPQHDVKSDGSHARVETSVTSEAIANAVTGLRPRDTVDDTSTSDSAELASATGGQDSATVGETTSTTTGGSPDETTSGESPTVDSSPTGGVPELTTTGDATTSAVPEATTGEPVNTTTASDKPSRVSTSQLISKGCRDVRKRKRAQRGVDALLQAYDEGAGKNTKLRGCLGQGYLALNKPNSALRHYRAALEEDFNNKTALLGAGKSLEALAKSASGQKLKQTHIEQAIRYYRRANADADVARLKKLLDG